MKRAKRGDITLVEACGTKRRGEVDPRDTAMCDSGGEWSVMRSRRERRRTIVRSTNEEDRPPRIRDRVGRLPGKRNRPEALLAKVREGEEWLETGRGLMGAKDALCESTGVRRTRSGDILVEIKMGVKGGEVARKIKEATGDKVLVSPLQSRVSFEIKDIDPLETKEDLVMDIANGLKVQEVNEVVKTLRVAPWGIQTAIAVVPAMYVTGNGWNPKIRTGLTIATMRVLPKVIRCYKFHEIEHVASKCSTISPGKERCRKCGAMDHTIVSCNNAPKCKLCSERADGRTDHVMGSFCVSGV
jgi:hypothetical protein